MDKAGLSAMLTAGVMPSRLVARPLLQMTAIFLLVASPFISHTVVLILIAALVLSALMCPMFFRSPLFFLCFFLLNIRFEYLLLP